MNLKSLSLQAIDRLLEYWATDTAKSLAESREESAAVIQGVLEQARIAIMDVDSLCLQHQVGAMAEDVDCIACFESERHDATIDELKVLWKSEQEQGFYHFNRANDAERRLGLARKALQAASRRRCWMCRRGFSFGRDSNGKLLHEFGVGKVADYDYCHAFAEQDALAQLGAPSPVGHPSVPVLTMPDLPDGYPEWFKRVYGYAGTQSRCIVAMSKCSPNDFYYLVNAALRELNVGPPTK